MRGQVLKIVLSLLALALPSAVVGITASAEATASTPSGTLVYVKSGRVYVARADGRQARAVTPGGNGWAWPSETDSGVIAVARGRSLIAKGFNPSGGDEIYECN